MIVLIIILHFRRFILIFIVSKHNCSPNININVINIVNKIKENKTTKWNWLIRHLDMGIEFVWILCTIVYRNVYLFSTIVVNSIVLFSTIICKFNYFYSIYFFIVNINLLLLCQFNTKQQIKLEN